MEQDIPPRDRPEWVEMAKGQIKLEKFVLQLQIDRVTREMAADNMTLDGAVDYLYNYFLKYPKGFRSDLVAIFKEW